MAQFKRKPTVEIWKSELQSVAKEMGLPIEDPKVPIEWCKRGGWYDDVVAEKLIKPLYFSGVSYTDISIKISIRETIIKLHNIANELGVSIENPKVALEFCKRGGSYDNETFYFLIRPLYSMCSWHGVQLDKHGKITAVKWKENGDFETL